MKRAAKKRAAAKPRRTRKKPDNSLALLQLGQHIADALKYQTQIMSTEQITGGARFKALLDAIHAQQPRRLLRVMVGTSNMDIAADGDLTTSRAVTAMRCYIGMHVFAVYRLHDGSELQETIRPVREVVVVVADGRLWLTTPSLAEQIGVALARLA